MKKAKSVAPTHAIPLPPPPRRWIYRHVNEIRRAFCGWAISQHPFNRPPNLFDACDALVNHLAKGKKHNLYVLRIHSRTVGKHILEFCLKNVAVVRWNKPRRGNPRFAFVTRYGGPKPEYDFIDLHALARNVTRQIVRDDQ